MDPEDMVLSERRQTQDTHKWTCGMKYNSIKLFRESHNHNSSPWLSAQTGQLCHSEQQWQLSPGKGFLGGGGGVAGLPGMRHPT